MSVEKTMDDDAYDALVKDATEARLAHGRSSGGCTRNFTPSGGR